MHEETPNIHEQKTMSYLIVLASEFEKTANDIFMRIRDLAEKEAANQLSDGENHEMIFLSDTLAEILSQSKEVEAKLAEFEGERH